MPSRANFVYRLLDPYFHESLERYAPCKSDFHDHVQAQLPQKWEIQRQGIWFYCKPPVAELPLQGWKIHVSAAHQEARTVLQRVIDVLFKRGDTSFKFALDSSILLLLNSKNWTRGGSGKFITVYPRSNTVFLEVIEELFEATQNCCGPYILSDRRYRDSNVVYYRFGGMRLCQSLLVTGERAAVLVSPEGSEIPDQRLAYPITPAWVEPPLPFDQATENAASHELKDGQYEIEGVLSFSNAGGVYRAIDKRSGRRVVIKEARPHVNGNGLEDAVDNLKREYRLLSLVHTTGIGPEPIELFQEWEHWFLVEEYLQGVTLSAHSASHNILLRTKPTQQERRQWWMMVRSTAEKLLAMVKVLHNKKIVFSDLSPLNLMICRNGTELKLIDFEGAYQPGIDQPANVYTPGFVSPSRLRGNPGTFSDDFYSAGAVLISYMLPVTPLFHLKPQARDEVISMLKKEGMPDDLEDLIVQLTCPASQPDANLAPPHITATPQSTTAISEPAPFETNYSQLVEGIVRSIKNAAAYNRKDRMFPADPKIFSTNPLSLAYGAAGVAYALHRMDKRCPAAIIDWILAHPITPENYPPGLYVGLAGIAWSLLETGAIDDAEKIMRLSFRHKLLQQADDIFYGAAGWGMTCLHFFQHTHDEIYLFQAIDAAKALLRRAERHDTGYCWPQGKTVRVGLAHGASGIALFMLYLYAATKDGVFLDAGEQALSFDLAQAIETADGGYSWPSESGSASPLYPYWRFGSSGIGQAVVRFYYLSGQAKYLEVLKKIFIDADRHLAVLPGRFSGLAGIGEFLLDAHEFTRDSSFLNSSGRIADSIRLFCVERDGIAFPGESLSRLCYDYGTGSAGIGLFLHRLNSRGRGDFMLDGLLAGQPNGVLEPASLGELLS
jgi:serine/threonine protein kinase